MTDPHSSRTSGYHLFLEPTGSTAETLKVLMAFLATDHGGPLFPPHITLLSRISADSEESLMEKTQALAASHDPFEIFLGDPAIEDKYFRALYLRMKGAKSLTSLHMKAAEVFSIPADEGYAPHLSLLYGNYPAEVKEEIVADVQVPAGMSFLADTIHLWRTEGEVMDWMRIGSFAMGVL